MSGETVRSHFGALAEDGVWASLYQPGAQVGPSAWSFLVRARRVVELMQIEKSPCHSVLDVGCGTAPIARSLVAMGTHYTGVDFSDQMVETAKQGLSDLVSSGRASLHVGDAINTGFAADTFDAVIAMGLLEYLSAAGAGEAIAEAVRVLRPGGVAIFTIPKRLSWARAVEALLHPVGRVIRWRPQTEGARLERKEAFERLWLAPNELDRICRREGLEKLRHRHYNTQVLCRPATLVAPRLCWFVNRPLEGVASVPGFSFLATGYIGMYRRA
jgi:ubiquinone/menaquinone biosynthesis C-methylase UbiE